MDDHLSPEQRRVHLEAWLKTLTPKQREILEIVIKLDLLNLDPELLD